MKKSLLALAVLGAFTSIASAQSSVTLYGRIDQIVTLQDPGSQAKANGTSKKGSALTRLNDGGVTGLGSSRIGFRGTEDLGDGLKAFFTLEAGVTPDSGDAGGKTTLNTGSNSFFNRSAFLGLSHTALGEIRLGRQETLSRENNVKINDISSENQFSIVEKLEGVGQASGKGTRPLFQNFGTRIDNGIRYTTPVFAGFQASAIVGLGERLATTASGVTNKASNYRGLSVVYSAGPLALDAIYEDLRGGVGGNGEYNNVITVGGSYDFGLAKVATAYQHTNNLGGQFDAVNGSSAFIKGTDVNAWNIGLAVPIKAFTVKVQYTGSSIDRPAGASSLDQSKYGGSLQYALSKRTTVYATATTRAGDNKEYYSRKSEYGVGVAHTF
ncbi:MAG: porin [Burkholderiales bacterium]